MFNSNLSTFQKLTSIILIVFALVTVIVFWFFVLNTSYLAEWYPKIGAFVATHGFLIGSTLWFYLSLKQRTLVEQWSMWFKKKDTGAKDD